MLRYGRENTLDWFRMLDGLLIGVTGNFCRLDVAAAFLFSLFAYFFFVGLASPDCLAAALAAVATAAAFSWKDFRRCLRKYNIFKVCRNNIWRISFDSFFQNILKFIEYFWSTWSFWGKMLSWGNGKITRKYIFLTWEVYLMFVFFLDFYYCMLEDGWHG